MKTKDILITVVAVALLGTLGYVWFSGSGLNRAPNVRLTLIGGKELNLTQLQGKPVLVTFWATDCPGCRKEVPHLVDLYNRYHPQGLEMVAVAMAYDPPAQVLTFQKDKNLPYPIAIDVKGIAAHAFGDVRLTPTTFVISGDGRVVFQKVGEFEPAAMEALIQQLLGSESST
jgi:peroxiredoxin